MADHTRRILGLNRHVVTEGLHTVSRLARIMPGTKRVTSRIRVAQLFVLCASATAFSEESLQYVFINKAPGIEWNIANPESFTQAGFEEIGQVFPTPQDAKVRVGVSFVFDFLRYDIEKVRDSLKRYLELSLESGVPVMINLDGQNWREHRPDLWNWWDPEKPGYDPDNVNNVEWCGWDASKALKIGWRNWGSQIRVLPEMNLASPAVLEAHEEALDALLPIVAHWYGGLPENRRTLFGGVKLGHEASIGVNAYYYPNGNHYLEAYPNDPSKDPAYGRDASKGWHGGLQPIGYAAVKTQGIKARGTLTRDDIAQVTHGYLTTLCRMASKHGLPRDKVYTHQGGTYAPWDKHLPFWPAFNDYATPGWSFYWVDPANASGLKRAQNEHGQQSWAAVEWWWAGNSVAEWKDHFERTLCFAKCRNICVYNWNCGLSLKNAPHGRQALNEIVRESAGRN